VVDNNIFCRRNYNNLLNVIIIIITIIIINENVKLLLSRGQETPLCRPISD